MVRPTHEKWDDELTVRAYEAFNERHSRYREANAALVEHAALCKGLRVMDVGAGTGRTAEAVLEYLGRDGEIVCVEPAEGMRNAGRRRLNDPRVRWTAVRPTGVPPFDRVLCGAAIWQLFPIETVVAEFVDSLAAGGSLCFNIPAAYVGEPDEPGGGRDPYLVELIAILSGPQNTSAADAVDLPDVPRVEDALARHGLQVESWQVRTRLTQAAYRDWLKIPLISDGVLGHVDPARRAALIDEAFRSVDHASWRWETWRGWTARKP